MWGALSAERTGVLFTIATAPRQCSHSRARVPRHSWPYFTVSDSRLPQPRGPGPRIYIHQEQGGIGFPRRDSCIVAHLHSCSLAMGLHDTVSSHLRLGIGSGLLRPDDEGKQCRKLNIWKSTIRLSSQLSRLTVYEGAALAESSQKCHFCNQYIVAC
jgi:hypothetical protein